MCFVEVIDTAGQGEGGVSLSLFWTLTHMLPCRGICHSAGPVGSVSTPSVRYNDPTLTIKTERDKGLSLYIQLHRGRHLIASKCSANRCSE